MSGAGKQYETGYALGDELLAYWRRLPRVGVRGLPDRDQLNPSDIKPLLPNFFLMEWIDRDTAIIRLRGTWLDERVERPREHYNLFEQYSDAHAESYKDFVEALLQQPCAASLRRQRVDKIGRSFCYHSSYFPMIGQGAGQDGTDNSPEKERLYTIGVAWLEALDDEFTSKESPVLYEGAKFIGATWIDIGFGVPDSLYFK